jgi:hypothetical protein
VGGFTVGKLAWPAAALADGGTEGPPGHWLDPEEKDDQVFEGRPRPRVRCALQRRPDRLPPRRPRRGRDQDGGTDRQRLDGDRPGARHHDGPGEPPGGPGGRSPSAHPREPACGATPIPVSSVASGRNRSCVSGRSPCSAPATLAGWHALELRPALISAASSKAPAPTGHRLSARYRPTARSHLARVSTRGPNPMPGWRYALTVTEPCSMSRSSTRELSMRTGTPAERRISGRPMPERSSSSAT